MNKMTLRIVSALGVLAIFAVMVWLLFHFGLSNQPAHPIISPTHLATLISQNPKSTMAASTAPGTAPAQLVASQTPSLPPLPPTHLQQYPTLAEVQATVKFTILSPSFVPDGLPLGNITVMDYVDGSQTVQITYAEKSTGEGPDANQKLIFIRMKIGGSPVTQEALQNSYKEVVFDIQPVTVRGREGFTYWEPSSAAGNSTWLAWNEGDLTLSIAMYGNWPQPTEANPHSLGSVLIRIAESLK